jgi:hypothetical protein
MFLLSACGALNVMTEMGFVSVATRPVYPSAIQLDSTEPSIMPEGFARVSKQDSLN